MPRCVSCDDFLTDTELMMERPDGEPEDMCFHCRGISYNPNSCITKEYAFQGLTEIEYIIQSNKDRNIKNNE